MKSQKKTTKSRINVLVRKMSKIGPIMEGSLAVTERMCGQENCVCRRGKKHRAMYLTWKDDRKTQSMYIPVAKQKEALAMSRNYKRLKTLIRKLSDLHKKALTRKDPPQIR